MVHEVFKRLHTGHPELSEGDLFRNRLEGTLTTLARFERLVGKAPDGIKHPLYNRLKIKLQHQLSQLPNEEVALFDDLFELFEIKHGIGDENRILLEHLHEKQQGIFIGFLGPLGIGKSTIAEKLTTEMDDVRTITQEPFEKNPFLAKSQQFPAYMLRSQTYYLFSNIFSDMVTRLAKGVSISDTSTLSDFLMWGKWYYQTGRFSPEDYETYKKLVNLFKPIIPRPDYLIVLSLEDESQIPSLKAGIGARLQGNLARAGETTFIHPDNQDLAIQNQIVTQLGQSISRDWGVKCINHHIDPLKVYRDEAYGTGLVANLKKVINAT